MEAYFSILVQNNRFVTLINIESQGDLKWQKIISHQRHTWCGICSRSTDWESLLQQSIGLHKHKTPR